MMVKRIHVFLSFTRSSLAINLVLCLWLDLDCFGRNMCYCYLDPHSHIYIHYVYSLLECPVL